MKMMKLLHINSCHLKTECLFKVDFLLVWIFIGVWVLVLKNEHEHGYNFYNSNFISKSDQPWQIMLQPTLCKVHIKTQFT